VTGDGHRPPRSLWYVLILAALMLYFFDIVARKWPPAEQWLGRLGLRWLPRLRGAARPEGSADGAGAAQDRPGETLAVGGVPLGELYVARLRRRRDPGESNWTVRR
jgi:hypothetical protein